MAEVLSNTGVTLWNSSDYTKKFLDVFDALTGTGQSNMRLLDTAINKLNEKLNGYYFRVINKRLCICKEVNGEVTQTPLVTDDGSYIASDSQFGLVKVDGQTITIDEKGVIHGVKTVVDSELSTTSENPVQNKVVTEAIQALLKKSAIQSISQSEYDKLSDEQKKDVLFFIN